MKPFWHPLSTVLTVDPPCLATPELLRLLLRGGAVSLTYAGDRMWPALRHGTRLDVVALEGGPIAPGTVVLVGGSSIPDLLRVEEDHGDEVSLVGDAEPGPAIRLPRAELLARALVPPARVSARRRGLRRLRIDLGETRRGPDDGDGDPARTVLQKYDYQAPFYTRVAGPEIDPELLEVFARHVPRPSRVLVVGSGSGRECFALARGGWETHGLDFSPEMVNQARARAKELGLAVAFTEGDLRSHEQAPGSLRGVLFTYDVYSFIPRADRVEALRRVREWLDPEGAVLLSARLVRTRYEKTVLALARRSGPGRKSETGDTHTRWIDGSGAIRRSFVHMFTAERLGQEIREAGFRQGAWVGGHTVLRPRVE